MEVLRSQCWKRNGDIGWAATLVSGSTFGRDLGQGLDGDSGLPVDEAKPTEGHIVEDRSAAELPMGNKGISPSS